MPLRITLPLVIGPKDVLDDSLRNFLQQSRNMEFSPMTAEKIFDICCHFFKEGLNLNRSGLTSEEITEFLELCKTASEEWPAGDSQKQDHRLNNGTDWTDLLMEKADIAFSYSNGLNQFCDFLDVIDQLSEKNISYHNAADSFIPQGMLAVNQDSPNKELAMEFVQKSLDARLQKSDLRDGFPVNSQALDSWKTRKSNMMMAVSDGSGPSYDTKWPSEEILQRFLERVKAAETAVFPERYTLELIKTEAVSVTSGDTSAKDAADRIMNQLELYYEE